MSRISLSDSEKTLLDGMIESASVDVTSVRVKKYQSHECNPKDYENGCKTA